VNIRAKFTVYKVTEFGGGFDHHREITLMPQYDTTIPEDQRFSEATPTGEFKMYVTNPAVIAELKPGKTFYIDLTPVLET
jgi:hypothetical protein